MLRVSKKMMLRANSQMLPGTYFKYVYVSASDVVVKATRHVMTAVVINNPT